MATVIVGALILCLVGFIAIRGGKNPQNSKRDLVAFLCLVVGIIVFAVGFISLNETLQRYQKIEKIIMGEVLKQAPVIGEVKIRESVITGVKNGEMQTLEIVTGSVAVEKIN